MMKRLLLTALLLLSSPSWAAPIDDALAANKRGDYAAELRITRPLAAKGEAWAQSFLGASYRNGKGVSKNHAEAVKWYRLAAAQGYAEAQLSLGFMLHYYKKDYVEGVKWYRLAAAQGLAQAQVNMGFVYSYGQGEVQDYSEAVKWHELAAAQGHEDSQFALGEIYQKGQGVPLDFVRAHMWFNLAAAKGGFLAETYSESRDNVATKMTPQKIAEAQKLARECQARNFKGC